MSSRFLFWQVAELEEAQRNAVEEIMSYMGTAPILKESAHADALEEHAEWAEILGVGYDDTQRRSLIYRHLSKLLRELRNITGGDATKVCGFSSHLDVPRLSSLLVLEYSSLTPQALQPTLQAKQLSDLLYCRAHAGEQTRRRHGRHLSTIQKSIEHKRDVAEAITDSLREFVQTLHDVAGKGLPTLAALATQSLFANPLASPCPCSPAIPAA